DYQQLLIVKRLTEQCGFPVAIVGCPVEREAHGLAMSSRNERLSPDVRKKASFIYETLLAAREKFRTEKAAAVKSWVAHRFKDNPGFDLEYVEIADAETLKPLEAKAADRKYRIFIAGYAEGVRLIDNIALD
ncbi:MAG: pantoate--beta-alanine ligase, partial [Sinomicrobium sp.]|nr:pantoate--beta-alanine ligase [Sinomicrobium sp.]